MDNIITILKSCHSIVKMSLSGLFQCPGKFCSFYESPTLAINSWLLVITETSIAEWLKCDIFHWCIINSNKP